MFDRQVDTPRIVPGGAPGPGEASERRSAFLRRHLVLLADGQPHLPDREPRLDRIGSTAPAQRREHVVAGHALGSHGPELTVQPGPELLQAHALTLTRPAGVPAQRGRPGGGAPAYARRMIPGTGSAVWDTILQIAIVLALLVSLVLLIRNRRGR